MQKSRFEKSAARVPNRQQLLDRCQQLLTSLESGQAVAAEVSSGSIVNSLSAQSAPVTAARIMRPVALPQNLRRGQS